MALDASYPFQVVVSFETREDACALVELLTNDLGVTKVRLTTLQDTARKESPARETRVGKTVLAFLPVGRSVHSSDVAAHLETQSYKGSSATSTLSKLAEQGDVRRLGDGYYQKIV
jgi:hypothetical protein